MMAPHHEQRRSLDFHREGIQAETDQKEKMGVNRSYIPKEGRKYYKNGARKES